MALKQPKVLSNFNLYLDGQSKAGRCDTVKLPDITILTEDHRGGGMDAPAKIDIGMEPLTLEFTMSEYDPAVLRLVGLSSNAPLQLTFRGYTNDGQGDEGNVVIQARGKITQKSPGEVTPGKKNTISYTVNLVYYRESVDGETVNEIDVLNARRIVGGVDQLAAMRAALAL